MHRLMFCAWHTARRPFTAASLVEELADTIPGFQDSALFVLSAAAAAASATEAGAAGNPATVAVPPATCDGIAVNDGSIRVVLVRKAQTLAADLAARFGKDDQRFNWHDAANLSGDSGVRCSVDYFLCTAAAAVQSSTSSEQCYGVV
jgi:hypothetical protein